MKTLVLGIGNTLLSDDGVGIKAARKIKERVESIDFAEAATSGIALLDYIRGYDKVVIIDSTNEGLPVGEVREFSLGQIEKSYPFLSHGINLPVAIELGKRCGEHIPKEIKIYGIGTKDTTTFKEEFSPEVEEAFPKVVEYIIEREFNNTSSIDERVSNG